MMVADWGDWDMDITLVQKNIAAVAAGWSSELAARLERSALDNGYHAMPHCSIRKQSGGTLIAMLCTACIVLFASEASAQCTARDVLQIV